MLIVSVLASIAYYLLLFYFFVLWARIIIDLVRVVNREWRPRGFLLVAVEAVYSLSDPPVKFFRRILPPLRMGPIAFDLGLGITMLCTIIAMSIVGALR